MNSLLRARKTAPEAKKKVSLIEVLIEDGKHRFLYEIYIEPVHTVLYYKLSKNCFNIDKCHCISQKKDYKAA